MILIEFILKKIINIQLILIIPFGLLFIFSCNGQEVAEDIDVIGNSELEEEFVSIFTGNDLTGWDGDSRFWSVENGAIVGETSADNVTERNTFLIWEGGEPSDFEIRFKYRFVEVGDKLSGNSGIQVRSERFFDEDEPHLEHRVRGYQPDFAVTQGVTGNLFEEMGSGRLVAPPGQRILLDAEGESHVLEKVGNGVEVEQGINHTEWNDYHVYANGDTIRTHINGHFMHELVDHRPEARHKGIIGFQIHTGPPMRVEFKEVELKVLH